MKGRGDRESGRRTPNGKLPVWIGSTPARTDSTGAGFSFARAYRERVFFMANPRKQAAAAKLGRLGGKVTASRDMVLTVAATLLIARASLRRVMRCGSEVIVDWLLPIDDALQEVYNSLVAILDGSLDAGEDDKRA